jgi:hypothetical protein
MEMPEDMPKGTGVETSRDGATDRFPAGVMERAAARPGLPTGADGQGTAVPGRNRKPPWGCNRPWRPAVCGKAITLELERGWRYRIRCGDPVSVKMENERRLVF